MVDNNQAYQRRTKLIEALTRTKNNRNQIKQIKKTKINNHQGRE